MVKARRRVMQMIQEKSHDFKQMSVDNTIRALESKSILPGTWGTHGAGVYAGRGAPAHGYQPKGYIDRLIAFPSKGRAPAIAGNNNYRFHHQELPVEDTVIKGTVQLGKGTYTSLPSKLNKKTPIGERNLIQDLEPGIRSSKSRRMYDSHITEALKKKGLTHDAWDKETSKISIGEDYISYIKEKLETADVPRKDMRAAIKGASGTLGSIRDSLLHPNRRDLRMAGGTHGVREIMDDVGRTNIAETGAYRKYVEPFKKS